MRSISGVGALRRDTGQSGSFALPIHFKTYRLVGFYIPILLSSVSNAI